MSLPPRKSVACWQPAGRAVITGRRSREARKIYFTDRTLSRNKGFLAFDTGRRQASPIVPLCSSVAKLYFTSRTLSGNKSLFAFNPGSVQALAKWPLHRRRQLYFTNHTLTGIWSAFLFQTSEAASRPESRRWALFLRLLDSYFADHILVRGTVANSGGDEAQLSVTASCLSATSF